MQQDKREKDLYELVLKDHVRAITLKQWPFNYHCGIWDKHKPDENGRQYFIHLNKTRGVDCMKATLIHELVHICDDLEGIERSNRDTEGKAMIFYEQNKKFVDYLWIKYVIN